MIKTYPEFIAVVDTKCALYAQIPEKHLSVEGKYTHDLYKAVEFNVCFASNATELLEMLNDDKAVENVKAFAGPELRQITRCLERLAAAENLDHTA